MAELDARAFGNPFIGRIDPRGQFGIGNAGSGKCGTGAFDNGAKCGLRSSHLHPRQILRDARGDVFFDQPRGNLDRIRHAVTCRAAVAFDDDPVQTHEHRAIMVVGVKMMSEQFGRRARHQKAEFGPQRAGKGAAQKVSDESRRPLDRLSTRCCR